MAQATNFGFDEEVRMLKDAARRFFDEKETLNQLRPQIEGTEDPHISGQRPGWFAADDWQEIVQLGWHLLAVPENADGIGMGLVAAVAVQEEVGRAAAPTPLTSTLQATFVLREAEATEQLKLIAAGQSMALAVHGKEGSLKADSTDVTVQNGSLTGTSWYVQDADKVDGYIVSAKDANGEVGLYHVDRTDVHLSPDRIVDLTRDQARLTFADTQAQEIIAPGQGAPTLSRAWPAVLTLLAADMAGAAEWQLQATAEYAKVRTQFDRPIGFFQAVKHPIVNMMIAVDEARSLVYNAACAWDSDPEDALRTALLAQSSASDCASFCSNRSTQLHGGIGFTWESDVQIYHKRQMHSQFLFGDASWHREQLAELL
ncbi:MAG: acyl-CoA dehydrogenase family protein [Pseudomonadota bacterium]